MTSNKEILAIMDYSTSTIHLYEIDENEDVDEDFIKKMNHNPDECSWMFGENISVYKNHREINII